MILSNDNQKNAISHFKGPCMVLAAPGSGKTFTIIQRTKKLIEDYHVNPENILVITFTKAASLEMKERFGRQTEGRNYPVTFGTFHAIFFMVLKYAYRMNYHNIVTEDLKLDAMRVTLKNCRVEYDNEAETIADFLEEISLVKNSGIKIENYYSTNYGETLFREIYTGYHQQLKKRNKIDFDDMLIYTYELFEQRKDILKLWQNKYQYILIDEFQDINKIQYDIIKMLALPENNLFMVGDDDQSIYGFRGSKPEIMLSIKKEFPNIKEYILDMNYRCAPEIVMASSNLIMHNQNRFMKRVQADTAKTGEVKVVEFDNQRVQNLFIIKEIQEKIKAGATWSEFAVLFRTNLQPRSLMEQLIEYNIPFVTKEQIPSIYDHWIADDLFTFLDIAKGSRKRSDFIKVMNKPNRYLSRSNLQEEQVSFQQWIQSYAEQPWIAERVERLKYDFEIMGRMNPFAAINYIKKGMGYQEYLIEYAKERGLKKEELEDILEELHESAKGYHSLEDWRQHISEYRENLKKIAKEKNQNAEAITLATLHGAKGLEFRFVCIIDVNEGIIPYKKAVLEKDIEEERRLFYVGMTRAKQYLLITSIKNIGEKNATASRFLPELYYSMDSNNDSSKSSS